MAVFSGGRWIRSQLLCAGDGFWDDSRSQDKSGADNGNSGSGEREAKAAAAAKLKLEERGLSFWHFDGAEDGEDVKAEFKRRLQAAGEALTEEERRDVVGEAAEIFRFSGELVAELDELVGTGAGSEEGAAVADAKTTGAEKEGGSQGPALRLAKSVEERWYVRPAVASLAVALTAVSWYAVCHLAGPVLERLGMDGLGFS